MNESFDEKVAKQANDPFEIIEKLSFDETVNLRNYAKLHLANTLEISDRLQSLKVLQQKIQRMDKTYNEMDSPKEGEIILQQKVGVEEQIKRIEEKIAELKSEQHKIKTEHFRGIDCVGTRLIKIIKDEILPKKREYLLKTESKNKYFVRAVNYLKSIGYGVDEYRIKYGYEKKIDVSKIDDEAYVDEIILIAHQYKYSEVCKCPRENKSYFRYRDSIWLSDTYQPDPKFLKLGNEFRSEAVKVNNKYGYYYCPNIADRNVFSFESTKCLCVFREHKICTIL